MACKMIIFDLDGTLVDTIEGLQHSMNNVLQKFSFPCHNIEAYKQFVGQGIEKLVYNALPAENRNKKMVMECYDLMIQDYSKNWDQGMTLYDGIEPLLNELTRRNIPMAINTNKNQEMTDEIVKKYLSHWNFVRVIGYNENAPRKPDPSGPLNIINAVRVSAHECAYIGDSEIDIQTARNAGMVQVSVTWGFRSEEQLKSHKPQILLRNPLDILQLVEGTTNS
jgi:phosphoglycolate phosphatase